MGKFQFQLGPHCSASLTSRESSQSACLPNPILLNLQGATFPVVNVAKGSEEAGDTKLQTFAFRLKAASQLNPFVDAINEHKLQQEKTHQVSTSDCRCILFACCCLLSHVIVCICISCHVYQVDIW